MARPTLKNQTFTNLSDQADYLDLAIEAFLIDRKAQNLAPGTLKSYRVSLASFQAYCDNELIKVVTDVTPDSIRRWLLYLESAGHNPGGVRWFYRPLKTFLLWYEKEFEPEDWKNPIQKVKTPKVPQEPIEPIGDQAFRELVRTCDVATFTGVRDVAILKTLLDSGVRAAELVALDVGDFNTLTGELLVRRGKGRKPRVTFVGKETRRAIRAWLRRRPGSKDGPMFTNSAGDRLKYSGLREVIRRRAKQAGIPEPALHDFRRAFCLAQLQAGVSETTIARLMGHSSTQLIARYARQTTANLQDLYHSRVDELKQTLKNL